MPVGVLIVGCATFISLFVLAICLIVLLFSDHPLSEEIHDRDNRGDDEYWYLP